MSRAQLTLQAFTACIPADSFLKMHPGSCTPVCGARIAARSDWQGGGAVTWLPSDTRCSRKGDSSFMRLRCSTSAHRRSTGMSDRTDRMRLLTNSSGASASSSAPTTSGARAGFTCRQARGAGISIPAAGVRSTERPIARGDSKQQASCSDLAPLMLDRKGGGQHHHCGPRGCDCGAHLLHVALDVPEHVVGVQELCQVPHHVKAVAHVDERPAEGTAPSHRRTRPLMPVLRIEW